MTVSQRWPRCGAPVIEALVEGTRIALDPTPLIYEIRDHHSRIPAAHRSDPQRFINHAWVCIGRSPEKRCAQA